MFAEKFNGEQKVFMKIVIAVILSECAQAAR